jgi:hypothetical protein
MISCGAPGEMQFACLTNREGDLTPYGDGSLQPDGHNAFSPDFLWAACDTYPETPEFLRRPLIYDLPAVLPRPWGRFPVRLPSG